MGVCRVVILRGRRGVRGRRGLGSWREVIPGTEQFTLLLTRRSPWRVAKWRLRKGDMMVLRRPMGGAVR
jgi:hypothetical protein